MTERLADVLRVNSKEIEMGLFLGRPIAEMDRDDLLAVIGWLARNARDFVNTRSSGRIEG